MALSNRLKLALLAGLALTLTACNPSEKISANRTNTSTIHLDAVENVQLAPLGEKFDEDVIVDLIARIEDGHWGKIDSLLIQKDGDLVVEEYFRGYRRNDLHRMYSVTKSVTSILIGIALHKGHIQSLDQTLLSFFPEYDISDIQNFDERKAAITLEDLLTMRAGFRWDEWSSRYGTPGNATTPLFQSEDWMKHMLDLPMVSAPGTRFLYNSGVTMLLSGIILNTTGQNVRAFAEQELFAPLGITDFDWELGPNDIYNTGWGSFLRPLDMLKIGNLMMNGGVYNGQRILPEAWVDASTDVHVQRSSNNGYGYQWWHLPMRNLPNHTPSLSDIAYASGWGGQHIYMVWDLDLLIIVTGENYDGAPRPSSTMIFDFIVPALNNKLG